MQKIISIFVVLALCCFVQGEAKKQKICLNMIVKNESPVIQRCLESAKPLIDYWVIVDTGSTDNTQEIITKTMQGVPGKLYQRPWKNFAHNRNEALDLAKGKGDYVLFIDADELFAYDKDFKFPTLDKDIYDFIVRNELNGVQTSDYRRSLLINNNLNWRWEGVLHEGLVCKEATTAGLMDGILTLSRTMEGARGRDPNKYLKDAFVLEEGIKDEPTNSRYRFYLAISYLNAGKPHLALENFQRRIEMQQAGGSDSEVFMSLYLMGCLQIDLKEDAMKITDTLTKAYLYRPWRAEPLYQLAKYFSSNSNYLLAYMILKQASITPLPYGESHFVQNWMYEWGIPVLQSECAFKLGVVDEAVGLMKKVLPCANLPQDVRKQLEQNLAVLEANPAQKEAVLEKAQ